jgi:hypothetical protein
MRRRTEVAVASAAFERAEGMLDNPRPAAHQVGSALHARAMTFENVFVFSATDGPRDGLRRETAAL